MKIIRKLYYTIAFIGLYFSKLVQANLYIAYDLLTPRLKTNPGFIKVPLILSSDASVLLFSNLVSMTPGSLSIDITPDRQHIIVHVLYQSSMADMLAEFEDLQNKIKRINNE
ncbi:MULTISPECIES: Na+/H+ antiporter subunit E [unclassified Carboxylicivirga]|uniref:Na+/H+ antiporter subunit E n=1 Tax=Carboxylicivirga TaxID=1628153 RepID=UPI003D32F8D6